MAGREQIGSDGSSAPTPLTLLFVPHDREEPSISFSLEDVLTVAVTNRGGRAIAGLTSYPVCGDDPDDRTQILRFEVDPLRHMSLSRAPLFHIVRSIGRPWRDKMPLSMGGLRFKPGEHGSGTSLEASLGNRSAIYFWVITRSCQSLAVDLRKKPEVSLFIQTNAVVASA